MKPRIGVLIVDDSASVRATLQSLVENEPDMHVVGAAKDPLDAAEIMRQVIPDVILLDLEMPRMNGLTFLRKVMSQHPIPVVICSSHVTEGGNSMVKALEFGAVEVIAKPKVATRKNLEESRVRITDAVRAASRVRVKRIGGRIARIKSAMPPPKAYRADVILPLEPPDNVRTGRIVLMGASTGGTKALNEVFDMLPAQCPPIVVVQHMPEFFTKAFADRLNMICPVRVREAVDGDALEPGLVLIAPGDRHMLLKRRGQNYHVEIKGGPLVNRHRPSVDVLFRSGARFAGANAMGVLLTGMGDDGARGLRELRNAGAYTVAQDEATSAVFGMPAEGIKLGGAAKVLPLGQVANEMVRFWKGQKP